MSDRDLHQESGALAEYAASGSQAAFRRVVQSTMPLVLGTALRRTQGRRDVAEDISQMVFIDLARQVKSVRGATLSAWLYRHTCFTASKVLRSERRRAERERIAAEQTVTVVAANDTNRLDEVLLAMPEADREALFLRCVEGRTHEEVAEALGISRVAAQKRSERAMERLRLLFRDGFTAGGIAAVLSPPLAEGAPGAQAITECAMQAASGSRHAFFKSPLTGTLTGAATAVALAAMPLRSAWLDHSRAAASPSGPASAAFAGTIGELFGPPALPFLPESPAAVVDALLKLPERYGLGDAARDRAAALLDAIPREWIHEVAVTLNLRVPKDCRGWHVAIGKTLAARWMPGRIPEDWQEAVKAIPQADVAAMFLSCGEVDAEATRRWLRGPGATEVPAGAAVKFALQHSPDLLSSLLDSSPRITWVNDHSFFGMDELRDAAKEPALRRVLMEQLPAMKNQLRRLMLERLVQIHEPMPVLMTRVETMADSAARAWAASAAAHPTAEALLWWEKQVPRERQPEMASMMAELYMRPEIMLPWIERMGEKEGGAEFDRLRVLSVQHHSKRDGAPYSQVADMANRITDPVRRIVLLGNILSSGYNMGNWKSPWMEQNLTPEERDNFSLLMARRPR